MSDFVNYTITVTGINAIQTSGTDSIGINLTNNTGATQYRFAGIQGAGSGGYIDFSAEL
jgi:hypothetical protein